MECFSIVRICPKHKQKNAIISKVSEKSQKHAFIYEMAGVKNSILGVASQKI